MKTQILAAIGETILQPAARLNEAGVAFTRNPAIGTNELYFDFQFNAQGEDVVSGRQHLGRSTPQP
jgi:phosphoenolpyruvate synthase/pyruvate phosphate dikinase